MKIICVEKNYADHALKLDNEVLEEPILFSKPETALVPKHNPFFIPDFSEDIHCTVELVVRINKHGKNVQEKFAHKYYDQVTVGIDFTARDIGEKLKAKGLPWEKAKSFDGSVAVGKFIDLSQLTGSNSPCFHLLLNNQKVQLGSSSQMLYSIDKLISYISIFFTLKVGDLLFTGAPSDKGNKVSPQDKWEAFIEDEKLLSINVK